MYTDESPYFACKHGRDNMGRREKGKKMDRKWRIEKSYFWKFDFEVKYANYLLLFSSNGYIGYTQIIVRTTDGNTAFKLNYY